MHNLYDANKCERYKVAEMKKYKDMSKDELLTLKAALMEEYKEEQAKGLSSIWQEESWIRPVSTFHADVR